MSPALHPAGHSSHSPIVSANATVPSNGDAITGTTVTPTIRPRTNSGFDLAELEIVKTPEEIAKERTRSMHARLVVEVTKVLVTLILPSMSIKAVVL